MYLPVLRQLFFLSMQVVVTSSFSSSCGIENKKQMITKIYFCFSLVRFWLTYYLSGRFSAFCVRSLSSPTVVIFPRLFTTEFMEVCSVIGFALMQGVWYLLEPARLDITGLLSALVICHSGYYVSLSHLTLMFMACSSALR